MNRIGLWDITIDFISNGLLWLGLSIILIIIYFIFIKFWLTPSLKNKSSKIYTGTIGIIISGIFFISFYKSLEPVISYIYFIYGNICISDGKYDNALWEFKEAVKLYPSNGKFNERAGLLSYVHNDYRAALSFYKTVHDLTPEGMIYYGASQIQLGYYKTGEKNIRSALDYLYNPGLAYFFIGKSQLKQKKYKEAETSLKTSLSTIVKSMHCLVNWELAELYIETNNKSNAILYAKKVVSSQNVPEDIKLKAKSFLKYENKNEKKVQNKP